MKIIFEIDKLENGGHSIKFYPEGVPEDMSVLENGTFDTELYLEAMSIIAEQAASVVKLAKEGIK